MSDDNGVTCPEDIPLARWAREQALAACVYGAPGWFAVPAGGEIGAVNVAAAIVMFSLQSQDDGLYRLVAAPDTAGYSLACGPYADEHEAATVLRAVLVLASGALAWPPAEHDDEAGAASELWGAA